MNLTFHCFTFKDEVKEDKNAEDRSKFQAIFKGKAIVIAIIIVIVITIFIYMYV